MQFSGVFVRQVVARLTRIKGKFQHLLYGSRNPSQAAVPPASETEILGDKLGVRAIFPDSIYHSIPRTLDPFALAGGPVDSRNGPIAFNPRKWSMRTTSKSPLLRADDPSTRRSHSAPYVRPVINWIAPILSVGAEPSGGSPRRRADGRYRSTGNSPVRPDISRIEREHRSGYHR